MVRERKMALLCTFKNIFICIFVIHIHNVKQSSPTDFLIKKYVSYPSPLMHLLLLLLLLLSRFDSVPPQDGSPPGSPVPGILQARTLRWVATSYSICSMHSSVYTPESIFQCTPLPCIPGNR